MVRIGRGLSRFSARGLSQFSRSENGTVPFGTAETRGLSQFSLGENGTVPFTLDYEELLRG